MLSSLLKSERAAQMNVEIMRAFVRLRPADQRYQSRQPLCSGK
jgi:hypothetical protein